MDSDHQLHQHHHHHHHHVTTDDTDPIKSNDLIIAKVVAMAVLGIVSFAIGMLPVKLTRMLSIKTADKDKNLVISLLLCFGGGVLLFTTFLHLQPEVRESFEHLESEGKIPVIGHGISTSELVFCLGFFFVYLIEELVHLLLHKKSEHEALHRSLSVRCNKKENMTIPRVTLNKLEDGNVSCISTSTKELLHSQTNLNFVSSNNNNNNNNNGSSTEGQQHQQQQLQQNGGHSHLPGQDSMKNSFRGLLAVLALSFHAVFEGLAVGLENSVPKVWYLFAAIATHKFVIGFCVGVELVATRTRTALLLIYIGTFAIVTPLGIGIGILLSETGGGSQEDIVSLILQGMAAGTLLYVVFFEVLSRERSNMHSGLYQLLAILAGFAVMFGLQFITGHEHSHGGGEEQEHEEHSQKLTTLFH